MKVRNQFSFPFSPHKKIIITNEQLILAGLHNLEDSIEIIDIHGKIIFESKKFQAYDGISRESAQGQPIMDFYSLTEQNSLYVQSFKAGKALKNVHQTYIPKGGRPINAVIELYPIYIKNTIVGAISITRDNQRVQQLIDELAFTKRTIKPHNKRSLDNGTQFRLENIWGETKIIKETIDSARHIAKTNIPVLISGETGTGKELFAQGIHNASDRANHKFVALNCSALPETLMEGLLFGTSKGAYTGAENRPGYFEEANHGTLFLDEINSMPLSLQAKLLRVLEDGRIRRLGGNCDTITDVRIISAMNITPKEAITGKFIRQDLFYRLSPFILKCPPLRRRNGDILIYCLMFIQIYKKTLGQKIESISRQAISQLVKYPWPGNVRELKHFIESTVISMKKDEITMDIHHFPAWVDHDDNSPIEHDGPERTGLSVNTDNRPKEPYDYNKKIRTLEISMIKEALTINNGNLSKTADFLNLSKQTLFYKLKRFNIILEDNIRKVSQN